MAFLNIDRSYESNKTPTQQDLDNIIDGIETFLNVTGVSDDNIQNNSVTGSTKLVDASITQSKLATNAVATNNIQDDVVTVNKIADSAVTTAKINNASVTHSKLADNAVNTNNIVNGSIDPEHLLPNHQQNNLMGSIAPIFAGAGSVTTTLVGTSTITTTNGVVLLNLNPISSSIGTTIYSTANSASDSNINFFTNFLIYRDGSLICNNKISFSANDYAHTPLFVTMAVPLGINKFLDITSAGSHTYSFYIRGTSTSSNYNPSISLINGIVNCFEV